MFGKKIEDQNLREKTLGFFFLETNVEKPLDFCTFWILSGKDDMDLYFWMIDLTFQTEQNELGTHITLSHYDLAQKKWQEIPPPKFWEKYSSIWFVYSSCSTSFDLKMASNSSICACRSFKWSSTSSGPCLSQASAKAWGHHGSPMFREKNWQHPRMDHWLWCHFLLTWGQMEG